MSNEWRQVQWVRIIIIAKSMLQIHFKIISFLLKGY